MTASIPLRIYLQHQFSKVCALERTDGENSRYFVSNYPAETPPYQGFSALRFQTPHLISSQSRYDHFDTAPYLSQHQHLGKRGELMGRTSKNIKLRIPEKPHKIKGFRSGSYRVATTISSQGRYDHFDTCPYRFNRRGGETRGKKTVSKLLAFAKNRGAGMCRKA